MTKPLKWSCDERDRANCRNAHGCHCQEITSLLEMRDSLSKLNHARAKFIDRLHGTTPTPSRPHLSTPETK